MPKPKRPDLPTLLKEGEILDRGFVVRDENEAPVRGALG